MGDLLIPRRDLDFLLYDWLDIGALFGAAGHGDAARRQPRCSIAALNGRAGSGSFWLGCPAFPLVGFMRLAWRSDRRHGGT